MKRVPLSELEHDPRFIARMEAARESLEAGRGLSMEQVRQELGVSEKRATARKRSAGVKRRR